MQNQLPETTRIAAYAIMIRDKQILLCRISDRVPESKGKWTLPGGGIEFGEHPDTAVVREVYEETGLTIKTKAILCIDSFLLDRPNKRHHGIRILYSVSITGGNLRNETHGSTDRAEWFPISEALELPLVELARTTIFRVMGLSEEVL